MSAKSRSTPGRAEPRPAPPPGLEPMLRVDQLAEVLNCSRREVERMRSRGRLPRPDVLVGCRSPRWSPATIRRWVESGGK